MASGMAQHYAAVTEYSKQVKWLLILAHNSMISRKVMAIAS